MEEKIHKTFKDVFPMEYMLEQVKERYKDAPPYFFDIYMRKSLSDEEKQEAMEYFDLILKRKSQ
ncbi:MAG: hypothetical protein FWE54_04065 [Methanimicrococcus sp.]|nr:hypothetical protein [Methanimicrococcus sp.]